MRVERLTINPPRFAYMSSPEIGLSPVLSETEFCDRIADAVPSEAVTYHVGMLARDRYWPLSKLPEDQRIALGAIANRALKLFEAGRVHLVQRRVGPDRFTYLAIVRSQPRQALRTRFVKPMAATVTEAA
jgi:hypothetical protein